MNHYDIILLAFALSIDVCVVSFSYGLCLEKKHKRSAFALALTTGCFHSFMPVLGYFFTDLIRGYVDAYSKWIVFFIFIYLGVNFIIDAIKNDTPKKISLNPKTLLLISIATSIDVFSAGISLSLTSSPMKFSVLVMGGMTFINSLIGYGLGYSMKVLKSNYLEILGGVILIILAIKNIL